MARNQPHSLAVGGLSALAAALGIGRFVYTPILPGMMADLGLTAGQAGLIASANYLGYLAGALASVLPLPASRRAVLIVGLLASCLTTLGMAAVSAPLAMMAIRFVGGFASAVVMVLASGIVLERAAAQGDRSAAGIYFAGVGIGIVISSLLVTIVQGAGLGWRVDWLICGLISLILTGLAVSKIDDVPGAKGSAPVAARFRGGVAPLVLGYGLFGLGYVVTATFLVAIIRSNPALQAAEPFAWLVVGIAAAPSVAFWLNLSARWGAPTIFALACLAEAVGVTASVAFVSQAAVLLAALLLGATFMGITALGLLAARERVSGNPQSLLAVMTAAFGIGQIVGPSAAGYLHDRSGDFATASYGAALALILAAVCALIAVGLSRPRV